MNVLALNNTDDQVFVIQTDTQPIGIPPIALTGGSPSLSFTLNTTRLTCWLPLNNSTKGPAKVIVDVSKVPSRVRTPSTTEKDVVYIFDVRKGSEEGAVELGLFKAAAAASSSSSQGMSSADKKALGEIGVALGVAVGSFVALWALIRGGTAIHGMWETHKDRKAMVKLEGTDA